MSKQRDPLAALCEDIFSQVNSAHSERVKMIAVLRARVLPLVKAAQAARNATRNRATALQMEGLESTPMYGWTKGLADDLDAALRALTDEEG